MNEQNIIVKQILSSDKNIELALSISNSIHQVKQQLIPEIEKVLNEIAKTYNLDFSFGINGTFRRELGFHFINEKWKYCSISFGFGNTNLNAMYYGIKWKTTGVKPDGLADAIKNRLGGKPNELWPSYKNMEHPFFNWEYSIEPWVGYHKELKCIIESKVKDILAKLEGLEL